MLGGVMKSVCTKWSTQRLAVTLSGAASRNYSSQTLMSESKKSPNRVFGNLPSNVVILGVDKENPIDVRSLPVIPEDCEVVRAVKDCPKHLSPVRTWLDSFESMDFTPTKVVELHPDVFAANPRIDFLHLCKEWQMNYREVDYTWMPTRAEVGRGRKKPWPQKGLGKARHGSTNAPQWKGGGIAHGPRGPKALYQKILPNVRLRALISALSIKYFQEDICIVQDFDVASAQQEELQEIMCNKGMNHSALLVHSDSDNIEKNANIASALKNWAEFNLMPLVGLNMWSLLHHEKLLLTLQALEELETKILWNLNRYDWIGKPHNFYRDLPFTVKNETSVVTDTPVSTSEE